MDDEFKRFYYPKGSQDPCSSSMEAQRLEEFEILFNQVWNLEETNALLPQTKNLSNFLILDKVNYFVQLSANIRETKNNFLECLNNINVNIEEMSRQIILCIQEREKELKAQLQEVKMEKISKWDRQLSACKKALHQLQLCERGSFNIAESALLNANWDEKISKELEFVEDDSLKLGLGNYHSVLTALRNLGTLKYYSNSKWCEPGSLICLKPKFIFGSSGSNCGEFCRPWGVCSDVTGRILVCDRSNHRIQIFNECCDFLVEFGKKGMKPGEFNRPSGIDVDEKCRIVVADKDNHRIQIFSYSGHFLHTFGSQGSRPGQFMYPWDVAVNPDCEIAVSDTKNHRVQLFNENGHFITLLDAKKLGYNNPRAGLRHFDSPRGLAFQVDGSLLVTDFNNHRILMVNRQFNKVSVFGSEGVQCGQFFRPQGIACDRNGRFVVADSKNYRIQIFDMLGNCLKTFGNQGSEPGQFDCPQGICFHKNQNIIVVDFNNNRVQVF